MLQLKSYAEIRSSSVSGGIEGNSQGFSAYKPDVSKDDYSLYNAGIIYDLYIPSLATSLVFLGITTLLAIIAVIWKKYEKIHNLAVQPKADNQKFHFKNLFCGLVSALMASLIFTAIYELYHIFAIGIHLKIMFGFFYWMVFGLAILLFISAAIAAFFIVHRASEENIMIPIPRLLYYLPCMYHRPMTPPPQNSFQRKVLVIWQLIAVWVIIESAVVFSFYTCGILLAVFVDPLGVVSTLAIYVSAALCGAVALATLFEKTDKIHGEPNNWKSYLLPILQIAFFLLAFTFIILFGYTYAAIAIVYVNNEDTGVFSLTGELFPIFFLPFISWWIRREVKKYGIDTTEDSKAEDAAKDSTASQRTYSARAQYKKLIVHVI